MSNSVLYMSMSLDGFITGPDDGPDNGLGTGGERLHAWLFDGDNEVRVGPFDALGFYPARRGDATRRKSGRARNCAKAITAAEPK